MLRKIVTVLAGLVMAGTAMAGTAVASPSGEVGPATFEGVHLQNMATLTCVDVSAANWYGSGDVRSWECQTTARQQWWFDTAKYVRTEIRLPGPPHGPSNKCLTPIRATWVPSGWIVETRTCTSQTKQTWYLDDRDQLYNPIIGKCLEFDFGARNGTQAALTDCRGEKNTRWYRF